MTKPRFSPDDAEKTFDYYSHPPIVQDYEEQAYITPCERLLVSTYIKPGMAILDIGVGGGRTSELLAAGASRYVGIDYVPEMIRICQKKYPQLDFLVGSATDLSPFQDGSFDVAVLSFNTLDDIVPDENRWRCLRECHRVLRDDGLLIFSSHNPRAIFARPDWKTAANGGAAQDAAPNVRGISIWSRLTGCMRALRRAARSSIKRTRLYAFKAPFWRGEGHTLDTVGLKTHFWVPRAVIHELKQLGFTFVAMQGDDYPLKSHWLLTEWYYYVFSKDS
ncbi:MAG TPA: class I SAM-dependent methyltransferase [Candidatus Angelobacter sp.]|nr:class I SAM-dependent methyltransferase [Candidatus Angelobacter sp.]